MKLEEKRALVIGASSGIGEAICKRLVRRGYKVAMVARRLDLLEKSAADINATAGREAAVVFQHDVTHFDEAPELFDRIFDALGGLSIVYYAAGVLPKVGPDEYNFEKDRQMVEVNLLGMIAWLNQAADLFTRLKSGIIVGIGSVAGDRGRRDNPVYNTSKGAQEIYLEALRNRLDSSNVRVVTIKPGFVDTAMTQGRGNLPLMISATEAARRIVEVSETANGVVYVPWPWRIILWIVRNIPSSIFRKLKI